MIESVAVGAGIAAASLLAMNAGPAMQRTAAALMVCWLASQAAIFVTGTVDPWFPFAAFNAVAAIVVLAHPSSRPQAVIGFIYTVLITVHLAYALVGSGLAIRLYLQMLSGGGWLQIAILAGGAIYELGKRRAVSFGGGVGVDGESASETGERRVAPGE